MKIVKAGYEILDHLDANHIYGKIELCGRVCYQSMDKIVHQSGSTEEFIRKIIKRGHESVLEHVSFTVIFIVDRGVSHELVRHRLASFSQESTRYCDYFGPDEMIFIEPFYVGSDSGLEGTPTPREYMHDCWVQSCNHAEKKYNSLRRNGATPQEARAVLPNSLKTEVVMTANLREWRHVLKLRTSLAAHPQMREVMCPLLDELKEKLPVIFEDVNY